MTEIRTIRSAAAPVEEVKVWIGLASCDVAIIVVGSCEAATASSASEPTAEARTALSAGAGSVGDCNGNPARCTAVSLEAGGGHTVALKADGTVWAWGTYKLQDDQLGWGDLSWLGRIRFHQLGGAPLGEVADRMFDYVRTF